VNIKLMSKIVYGNKLIYPNCKKSKLLTELTGKKTLDNRDIGIIKVLGYEVLLDASEGIKL